MLYERSFSHLGPKVKKAEFLVIYLEVLELLVRFEFSCLRCVVTY